MKILRAFQVIKKDGEFVLTSAHNEVDGNTGETIKQNVRASFYVVDQELKSHIDEIEKILLKKLEV